RDAILDTLVATLQREGPKAIVLVGEPGAGKSHLIRALARRLEGWIVLETSTSEVMVGTKYIAQRQTPLAHPTPHAKAPPLLLHNNNPPPRARPPPHHQRHFPPRPGPAPARRRPPRARGHPPGGPARGPRPRRRRGVPPLRTPPGPPPPRAPPHPRRGAGAD